MKKNSYYIISIVMFALFWGRGVYYMVQNATYKPQQGDVIFHVSKSSQSAAIKLCTWSRYSHCGIVIMKNGKPYVLEAENGVELTPMPKWLKRGRMWDHYRVMRLRDDQKLSLPYSLGGKYDRAFRFNNGKFYCSELVWELYKKNKILLCEPNQLKEYHFLYLPMVKKQIESRGFNLDQEVVAPVDLVKSRKLHTVSYGYGKPFWL